MRAVRSLSNWWFWFIPFVPAVAALTLFGVSQTVIYVLVLAYVVLLGTLALPEVRKLLRRF